MDARFPCVDVRPCISLFLLWNCRNGVSTSLSIFAASVSCDWARFSVPETMRCQGIWKILGEVSWASFCPHNNDLPQTCRSILLRSSRKLSQASCVCFFNFASLLRGYEHVFHHRARAHYLKPIGDVGIDFVDDIDAIIEDVDGLFWLQRSLWYCESASRRSIRKRRDGTNSAGYSCLERSMVQLRLPRGVNQKSGRVPKDSHINVSKKALQKVYCGKHCY